MSVYTSTYINFPLKYGRQLLYDYDYINKIISTKQSFHNLQNYLKINNNANIKLEM